MSFRPAPLASLMVLAACAGASTPPPQPLPPAPPPPPPAVTVEVSGAPTALPAAPPPAPESPFHVVARAEGEDRVRLTLFAPERGLFVSDGGTLFEIRDGAVVRTDAVAKGVDLNLMRPITAIAGRWPEAAYATLMDGNGRVGWSVVLHWEGAAWKPVSQLPLSWVFVGVSPWDKGRLVGLAVKTLAYTRERGYEFRVLDGPHGGPFPKLTPPTRKCKRQDDLRIAEVTPNGFLALPSGHAFVAGEECDGEVTAVEWFAPGATQGTIATLAEGCWVTDPLLTGTRPEDVFVGFKCRNRKDEPVLLYHFDGKAFAPVPYPGKTVDLLQVTPGGVLFANDDKVLRRRAPDGTWSEVPLPDGLAGVSALHVAAEDDLWATSGGAVLRTRPVAEPQHLAWPAYGAQMARTSFAVPHAATSSCESIFALLFTFSRVTPDDYDFPLTRKALAGHKELDGTRLVVTRDRGRKYFGAFAPSLDAGKKLVAAVKRGVPDTDPELLCVKPEVVREMPIDWATGEVKKPAP
jgi:hypothetical protein